jgi:hypothetical protein
LNTNIYGGNGFGTMAGSNGTYAFSNSNTTIGNPNASPALTVGELKSEFHTPLLVNGRDVMQEIDEMRDALLLLKRDVNMEEKYPKLKELKDAYERQLEKYKTFEALK